MNSKQCKCGNELLIQLVPQVTNTNDFRVWKVSDKCKAEYFSTPLFLCPSCGRIELPATSLSGRNRLDPEYIIYEKLLGVAKVHNDEIEKYNKVYSMYNTNTVKIAELEFKITSLEKLIKGLKDDIINMNLDLSETDTEEETKSDVKTGSRGRKSTKAAGKES